MPVKNGDSTAASCIFTCISKWFTSSTPDINRQESAWRSQQLQSPLNRIAQLLPPESQFNSGRQVISHPGLSGLCNHRPFSLQQAKKLIKEDGIGSILYTHSYKIQEWTKRATSPEAAPVPTSSGLPVLIPELSTDMAEGWLYAKRRTENMSLPFITIKKNCNEKTILTSTKFKPVNKDWVRASGKHGKKTFTSCQCHTTSTTSPMSQPVWVGSIWIPPEATCHRFPLLMWKTNLTLQTFMVHYVSRWHNSLVLVGRATTLSFGVCEVYFVKAL